VSRRTQDPLGRERSFDYRAVTFYGGPFQTASSTPFLCNSHVSGPTTPRGKPLGLGCSRFARRYSGNRGCFLLLRVLRCFSSPGVPSIPYGFRYGYCPITGSGFPHSDISGSTLAYSSPKRFGVCPVLHRLLVPRHPPCALSNLTMRKQLHACRLRFSASSNRLSSFQGTRLLPCIHFFAVLRRGIQLL
jgi:hypothetical protein